MFIRIIYRDHEGIHYHRPILILLNELEKVFNFFAAAINKCNKVAFINLAPPLAALEQV